MAQGVPLVFVLAHVDGSSEEIVGTRVIAFLAEYMGSENQYTVMVRQLAAQPVYFGDGDGPPGSCPPRGLFQSVQRRIAQLGEAIVCSFDEAPVRAFNIGG